MSREERKLGEREAVNDIIDTLRAFEELAAERQFELIVLLYPESAYEIFANRYEPSFGVLADAITELDEFTVIDLLPFYEEHRLMTNEPEKYFWPIDAHHNARGYAVMGHAAAAKLLELDIVVATATDEARPAESRFESSAR